MRIGATEDPMVTEPIEHVFVTQIEAANNWLSPTWRALVTRSVGR